jgi:D-amino-acid dehydrogenase
MVVGEKKRIVIIGGGVVGLCSAYYALERGHEVVVLERGGAGHDSCSLGNAGLVVPSHVMPLAAPGVIGQGLRWMWNPESPFYIKPRWDAGLVRWAWRFWRASSGARAKRAMPVLCELNMRSRQLFEEMASGEDAMDFGLEQRGLLMLYKTAKAGEEEAAAAHGARALGLRIEELDAKGVAAMEPGVELDVAGAVYYADDCMLRPRVFLAGLEKRIVERGGEIRRGRGVEDFAKAGGRVRGVVLEGGEMVEGDEFVVSRGVWSKEVAKTLGVSLPMEAGKGYSVTVEHPPVLPKHPALLLEARVAVTPMGQALRIAGTMELTGLDKAVNPRRVRGMVKSVPAYLPEFGGVDFEACEPWAGLRPCSPDGLPYLGRLGEWGNVVVACGHAMLGLSMGPVTGDVVARLVSGEEAGMGIDLLSPERYG